MEGGPRLDPMHAAGVEESSRDLTRRELDLPMNATEMLVVTRVGGTFIHSRGQGVVWLRAVVVVAYSTNNGGGRSSSLGWYICGLICKWSMGVWPLSTGGARKRTRTR